MSYQMLVSGGRDFDDYDLVWNQLHRIMRVAGVPRRIIHGGAPGADSLASRFAYEEKIDLKIEGALWGTYNSSAGGIRNRKMLKLLKRGDWVVCFPGPNSKGTYDMFRIAAECGKVHVLIVLDGKLEPVPQLS